MRIPFALKFNDEEEKRNFCLACKKVDAKRVFIYVSIIAAFETFLLIYDFLSPGEDYSATQWAYIIMNSFMAGISIIFVAITAFFYRHEDKYTLVEHISLCLYSVLILACSIMDAVTGTISSGRENLTMFFICLMLVSCVFYVDSIIVLFSSVGFFTAFEIFTHYTDYSSHHTYAPYPVFIIFITVTVSFVRSRQMLGVIRDAATIRKFRERAERENMLKSQFLANMSHEIRTPMNAIVGMSELAMDFKLSASEKNILRQIRASGISLVGIINDILDFSKIESGKMEIFPVEYDLLKLLNDTANVALVRLKDKNVELLVEADPELPAFLTGDDVRIRQILINLAGNASKFTEKGSVTIRAENLKKYEGRNGLRLSVIDTGVGIKEDDLKKLFTAFQQVDMKMNRTKGGTGLGLSISKRLAELMGGSIGVESEYGRGSVFYVNIPQEPASEITCGRKYSPLFEEASFSDRAEGLKVIPVVTLLNRPDISALFAEKNASAGFKASEARVLVVDDNEVNIQVADGLLKKFGIVCDTALSGFKALESMAENRYDIVFMDHQMPVMDGVETLRKIRTSEGEKGLHTVTVALSANAVNGAREMFLREGFDDFLAKPVQGKDFARCLLQWLPPEKIQQVNSDDEDESLVLPPDFPQWDTEKLSLMNAAENSGSLENYLKTVKTYYTSIPKKADYIIECLEQDDIKNFTIQVHALKSSSRIIGAYALGEDAEKLELLGKDIQAASGEEKENLKEKLREKAPALVDFYRSYTEVLAPVYKYIEDSADSGTSGGELDDAEVKSILDRMADASRYGDLDTVEKDLDILKKAHLSENASRKMSELEEAVENIEFNDIIEIAVHFLDRISAGSSAAKNKSVI